MALAVGLGYRPWPYTEQLCGECGITFGMPDDFRAQRLRDRQAWYCPNGHPRVFAGEREEDKLRRQVDQLKREVEWKQSTIRSEQIRRGKAEAKARRLETRIGAGVCPCCQRTFKQLAQHMTTKHPDYGK